MSMIGATLGIGSRGEQNCQTELHDQIAQAKVGGGGNFFFFLSH